MCVVVVSAVFVKIVNGGIIEVVEAKNTKRSNLKGGGGGGGGQD